MFVFTLEKDMVLQEVLNNKWYAAIPHLHFNCIKQDTDIKKLNLLKE